MEESRGDENWPLGVLVPPGSLHATSYLFLARTVVLHAVLGSHGRGVVQRGSVEGHLLNLGDVAGDVGRAQPLCLVPVPPVLEELLEQGGLTALRQDLDLKRGSRPVRGSLARSLAGLQF